MPKLGMQPVRERQLVEAALQVLSSEGFARTTMARVGRRAGLSTGTVQHYFHDKEGLLAATLAALNKRIGDATRERMRTARSPIERLHAIADVQFDDEQFSPDMVAVWHALWGNLREVPRLVRLQTVFERRMQSNVRHAMRQIVPAADVVDQTDSMLAMIYGLWMKAAQPANDISPARARRLMRSYLQHQVVAPYSEPVHE